MPPARPASSSPNRARRWSKPSGDVSLRWAKLSAPSSDRMSSARWRSWADGKTGIGVPQCAYHVGRRGGPPLQDAGVGRLTGEKPLFPVFRRPFPACPWGVGSETRLQQPDRAEWHRDPPTAPRQVSTTGATGPSCWVSHSMIPAWTARVGFSRKRRVASASSDHPGSKAIRSEGSADNPRSGRSKMARQFRIQESAPATGYPRAEFIPGAGRRSSRVESSGINRTRLKEGPNDLPGVDLEKSPLGQPEQNVFPRSVSSRGVMRTW